MISQKSSLTPLGEADENLSFSNESLEEAGGELISNVPCP